MSDIKKILVPVDFSANAEKLIDYVVSFASEFPASPYRFSLLWNPPLVMEGFVSGQVNEAVKTAMERR